MMIYKSSLAFLKQEATGTNAEFVFKVTVLLLSPSLLLESLIWELTFDNQVHNMRMWPFQQER